MKFLKINICVFILITVADGLNKNTKSTHYNEKGDQLKVIFFGSVHRLFNHQNTINSFETNNSGRCTNKLCNMALKSSNRKLTSTKNDERLQMMDEKKIKEIEAKLRSALKNPRFFNSFIGSL